MIGNDGKIDKTQWCLNVYVLYQLVICYNYSASYKLHFANPNPRNLGEIHGIASLGCSWRSWVVRMLIGSCRMLHDYPVIIFLQRCTFFGIHGQFNVHRPRCIIRRYICILSRRNVLLNGYNMVTTVTTKYTCTILNLFAAWFELAVCFPPRA